MAPHVRERSEILNLGHSKFQAPANWAPVPEIPDTTPVSTSHAESQNSGQAGMGAGPGGAKCVEARRSRKRVAAAGGSGGLCAGPHKLTCGGEWRQKLRGQGWGGGRGRPEVCPNLLCCGHAFPGHGWVPSNGDGLSHPGALVTLLGNTPSRFWECLHRARPSRSSPVGMASSPVLPRDEPHPPFSTWACQGLRGHFPLGSLPPPPIPSWALRHSWGGWSYLR